MFFIHRIIESYFNDNCLYLDFTSMHTARHLCVRFLHAPNALWIKFAILVLFIFITVIFICCICWVILKKESSVNQSISISLKLDFNINASANLCLTGKQLHVYLFSNKSRLWQTSTMLYLFRNIAGTRSIFICLCTRLLQFLLEA